MASVHTTRTFLSGELLVGVKQSDPNGILHLKRGRPTILYRNTPQIPSGRYLSEEPSTYLR